MTRVSVVIPTYNRRRYVVDAVRSAIEQTLAPFEIIVVDDGSTDGTRDVLRDEFGSAVTYVNQQNSGRSTARNRGIALAGGEYVAFLDSDDIWDASKLASQVDALSAYSTAGLSHTYTYVIDAAGRLDKAASAARRQHHLRAMRRGYSLATVARACIIFTSSVLVRRSCLERIGPFDPALSALEDWDWYLRAAQVTEIVTVTNPLVGYRLHDGNTTMEAFTSERIRVAEKNLNGVHEWSSRGERATVGASLSIHIATANFYRGDLSASWRRLAEAAAFEPRALLRPECIRLTSALLVPSSLRAQARRLKHRLSGS